MAGGTDGTLDGLTQGVNSVAASAENGRKALEGLNDEIIKGGQGFEGIINHVKNLTDSLVSLPGAFGDVLGSIPLMAPLGDIFKDTSKVMKALVDDLGKVAKTYVDVVGSIDAVSGTYRQTERALYDLNAAFGKTFGDAKEDTDAYMRTAKQVGTIDFGFVEPQQLLEAASDARGLGLNMEFLADETGSADSAWLQLAESIRHAQALGITTTAYMGLLNNAIMTQGLNVEEATKQMAMFKDISTVTGLSVDKIAEGLQGASDQFALLGMKADFGRPFLEGFTKTLDSMGLGIGKAIGLTGSLTKAFGDLSTNYGLAYVTSQRGGLDFGAGQGVLGAGIGMQAKMLEAEKTGDQAGLGRELAGAMRDTLSSFTGGQIVTVQQAADNPELQQTYYAQTQMLQQMYGLDSTSSARTLELLTQLDDATRSGDQNLADSVAEQLADGTSAQNETVDATKRLEVVARAQLLGMIEQNKWLSEISRKVAITGEQKAEGEMLEALSGAQELLNKNQKDVNKFLSGVAGGDIDTGKDAEQQFKNMADKLTGETSADTDNKNSQSKTTSGASRAENGTSFIDDFKGTINSLSQVFDKLISNLDNMMGPTNVGNKTTQNNMNSHNNMQIAASHQASLLQAQSAARTNNPITAAGTPSPNQPNNGEFKITVRLEPGDELSGMINPTVITMPIIYSGSAPTVSQGATQFNPWTKQN